MHLNRPQPDLQNNLLTVSRQLNRNFISQETIQTSTPDLLIRWWDNEIVQVEQKENTLQ